MTNLTAKQQEYGDISPRTLDFLRHEMQERVEPSIFEKLYPAKPLTKRQRIKNRFAEYGRRLSLAWAALRGDDVYRGEPS